VGASPTTSPATGITGGSTKAVTIPTGGQVIIYY
jgi:hypothetical protein